jgi:hypothetical protein
MIGNPAINATGAVDGVGYVGRLIPALIAFGFLAGVVFFFLYFIMGAIQWIQAGGDKQGLETAKSRITSAITGMVILFALFAVLNLVSYFFGGISILTLDIAPLVVQ